MRITALAAFLAALYQITVTLPGPGPIQVASAPTTPALLTSYSSGTDNAYLQASNTSVSAPTLKMHPSWPSIGGTNNCLVVTAYWNDGFTLSSISDDKSNSYTSIDSVDAHGIKVQSWVANNDTAGTYNVSIALTGTGNATNALGFAYAWLGGWVEEYENCGSIGGIGTLNTAATGSAITLTLSSAPSSGDMAIGHFVDIASYTPFVTSVSPGSGYTSMSRSINFGKLSEYNTSTTSTSMAVTYSGTDNILGVGFVLKEGSAGTGAPGTKYIDHYQVELAPATTTPTFDFPCAGNLITGMLTSGAISVSSITGSTGTWNTGIKDTTNAVSQIVYATSATCASTSTVSPTFSSTPGAGVDMDLVSVSNAATSSTLDKTASTSGTQSTAANFTSVSLTPAATGEIIFSTTAISWHTETAMVADSNSHTPTLTVSVDTKADDANSGCASSTPGSTLNEDNGYAYYVNSANTTAVTFVYSGTQNTGSGSCTSNPAGVGGWSAVAAAFK